LEADVRGNLRTLQFALEDLQAKVGVQVGEQAELDDLIDITFQDTTILLQRTQNLQENHLG
jgi:hypothetical protein